MIIAIYREGAASFYGVYLLYLLCTAADQTAQILFIAAISIKHCIYIHSKKKKKKFSFFIFYFISWNACKTTFCTAIFVCAFIYLLYMVFSGKVWHKGKGIYLPSRVDNIDIKLLFYSSENFKTNWIKDIEETGVAIIYYMTIWLIQNTFMNYFELNFYGSLLIPGICTEFQNVLKYIQF